MSQDGRGFFTRFRKKPVEGGRKRYQTTIENILDIFTVKGMLRISNRILLNLIRQKKWHYIDCNQFGLAGFTASTQ